MLLDDEQMIYLKKCVKLLFSGYLLGINVCKAEKDEETPIQIL